MSIVSSVGHFNHPSWQQLCLYQPRSPRHGWLDAQIPQNTPKLSPSCVLNPPESDQPTPSQFQWCRVDSTLSPTLSQVPLPATLFVIAVIASRISLLLYCPVTLSPAWSLVSHTPPTKNHTWRGFPPPRLSRWPTHPHLPPTEGLSYKELIGRVFWQAVTPVWRWEGQFWEGVYFRASIGLPASRLAVYSLLCQHRAGQHRGLHHIIPTTIRGDNDMLSENQTLVLNIKISPHLSSFRRI